MIETYGRIWWGASHTFGNVIGGLDAVEHGEDSVWPTVAQQVEDALGQVVPEAERIGIGIVTDQARRVRVELFRTPRNLSAVRTEVRDLGKRIFDELRQHRFFAINSAEARYFDQPKPLWEGSCDAFSADISEDIEEAGKCLAMGRNTACVFHLMRVMDSVLDQLAARLGATDLKNPNWGTKLEAMRTAIAGMPQGPKREEWREARALLEAVKDGWRNATVHPQNTYTSEDAAHIFHCVRSFTVRLARLAVRPQTDGDAP